MAASYKSNVIATEHSAISFVTQPTDQQRSVEAISSPRVLVVLCTYNEADNLPKMFDQLDEYLPDADVLVVDDNSPDGTADIVRQRQDLDSRYHLLLRSGKLGLGSALRDGIRWCLARGFDYLINLDADHSHDPARIPALLEACLQPGVNVAVGSRYIPGGGLPGMAWHRKLVSRFLNGYATRMLRLPISDCSGSYRCYSAAALRRIELSKLTCNGYGFLEEILVALHRNDAEFSEVPIQFESRLGGQSKLGWRDAVGALKVIHTMARHRK